MPFNPTDPDLGNDAVDAGMDVMTGGEPAAQLDQWINYALDELARRTSTIFGISATASAAAVRSGLGLAQDAIGGLVFTSPGLNRIVYAAAGVTTGTELARQAVVDTKATQSDLLNVYDGLLSPNVYNRNITWARRAVVVGDNGALGYVASKRALKQDFSAPEWTPEQMLQFPVLHYRYRAAVARERRGEGTAATEIGTIADDLHDLGLTEFVIYEDGIATGVHYELIGLAAMWLAQKAYELAADNAARLDALEGE